MRRNSIEEFEENWEIFRVRIFEECYSDIGEVFDQIDH